MKAEHLGQTNLMLFATPATQSPAWDLRQGSRKRARYFIALGIQVSTASRQHGCKVRSGGLTKADTYQLQEVGSFCRCDRSWRNHGPSPFRMMPAGRPIAIAFTAAAHWILQHFLVRWNRYKANPRHFLDQQPAFPYPVNLDSSEIQLSSTVPNGSFLSSGSHAHSLGQVVLRLVYVPMPAGTVSHNFPAGCHSQLEC